MPSTMRSSPTRVEVFGSREAAETWCHVVAGRDVEVTTPRDARAFPGETSDLAIAIVGSEQARELAEAIASRGNRPTPAVALLIEKAGQDHVLGEFAHALAQAKREWEQAFDAIVDPVAVLDKDGRVRRANRALTTRLNRTFDSVVGEHYTKLLGAAMLTPDPIAEALASGQPLTRETGFAALAGVFQLTISPLVAEPAQQGLVLILKDVTELRNRQERLAMSHRLADVGRLAGGVAHEISTPLASIALRAENLLRRAQDERLLALDAFADFPRYLKTIEEETFRCKRIIGALLEFSRSRPPEVVPIDLNLLVERAASLVADQMKTKQVTVRLRLAPTLSTAMVDEAQIREALIALLLNALDACDRAGVVTIATDSVANERVRLVVSDNGVGIAPENLDKVATPFFTTKPVGQATGLGLSICQGIVQAHGGEMHIESALGQGTRVTIELPLRLPSARDASAASRASQR